MNPALVLRRLLPPRARRRLRWLADYPLAWRMAADGESVRTYMHLSRPGLHERRETTLRLRELPIPIVVREGASDWAVVRGTIAGRYHLPMREPRLAWDLGANIGLTAAHMAVLYPAAKVIAVEPDPDNARIARENLRFFRDRCELVEAAVWLDDGMVNLAREDGRESGSRVAEHGEPVAAVSPATLVSRFGQPDFVKMDIEGTERILLRGPTEWATSVREIRVEVHGSYTTSDCAEDLRRLGFEPTVKHERMARESVLGLRA